MLTKQEQELLHQLCANHPEAAQVRDLLQKEHQFQLSMISHEIRNPVTLINSFLQLLGSSHPEIKESSHWNNVMENMQFLRLLLSELSDYNNSQKLNRREMNLYRMICSFLDRMRPVLEEQGITVTFEKQGAIPPFLLDSDKLTQVFLNMIRNAAEAFHELDDERQKALHVTLHGDLDEVNITIRDNGPGIAPEHMATLFDFFVTHKKEGTGLGLAICKNIIEAHGGTITVHSTPKEGTAFIITLPILFHEMPKGM